MKLVQFLSPGHFQRTCTFLPHPQAERSDGFSAGNLFFSTVARTQSCLPPSNRRAQTFARSSSEAGPQPPRPLPARQRVFTF